MEKAQIKQTIEHLEELRDLRFRIIVAMLEKDIVLRKRVRNLIYFYS